MYSSDVPQKSQHEESVILHFGSSAGSRNSLRLSSRQTFSSSGKSKRTMAAMLVVVDSLQQGMVWHRYKCARAEHNFRHLAQGIL